MKKILPTLFCLFIFYSSQLQAQIVSFNDDTFKEALLENELINTNGDDEIQIEEAASFQGTLNVDNLGILDLTGIEAFTSITFLQCGGNYLTELDISKNVSLKKLFCYFNKLTSLEMGNNEALEFVLCDGNNFETFNLKHSYLDTFIIRHNNIADLKIEIEEENAILFFDCNDNLMTSFDPSNLKKLKYLNCDVNEITELNLSENLELEYLDCHWNPLEKINISNNVHLQTLNVEATSLTEIDLSNLPELETFYAGYTNMPFIDLSKNPNLKKVDFYYATTEMINIKNGNNTEINSFNATLNNDLNCVQVDDSLYSVTNWIQVEEGTVFRENCPGIVSNSNRVELTSVNVFPNPSSGSFNIDLGQEAKSTEVKIFDQLGHLIQQFKFEHQSKILVNHQLISGMYLLQIETESAVHLERMLIL